MTDGIRLDADLDRIEVVATIDGKTRKASVTWDALRELYKELKEEAKVGASG